MLLSFLLPWANLATLRFTMLFLARVAKHSDTNKMDVQNLALCLAPNLMQGSCKAEKINSESKVLQVIKKEHRLLSIQSED